ncbi:spondin-1 [Eurytemora carolleeae]|uniref:spondin-1 n=1 Tax=Eurytemora carolleeae TaxID=1294199 RepID=UPI000C758391|nr:spondin-1 [Eurytemora carolleeae]|eukprot:XP_023341710.1 spondin-1-like [Eurytemora affinis]
MSNKESEYRSRSCIFRLLGRASGDEPKRFSNFLLVSENTDSRLHTDPASAGSFQLLGDVLTRFSDHCTNTITETSSIHKQEIQVLWTAPSEGNGCISFKAMVVVNRTTWSMDNGGLNLEVCEKLNEEEEENFILDDCCACSEAKYEVMFEGLWSKETHPKDFPLSEWLLHFSDVIGASHSIDYRVWEAGGLASKGLTQVAKWGSPRVLESELKAKSSHIRTIIKSRGLWFPNVNGKTFAILRTDSRNHLVSLVSMLGPSPDWIVGVSALEMCQINCTWIDNKVCTYHGEPDTHSSLAGCEVGPWSPWSGCSVTCGKGISSRQRNYADIFSARQKSCNEQLIQREMCSSEVSQCDGDSNFYSSAPVDWIPDDMCGTTEWSGWSECSATCGLGFRIRTRRFFNRMGRKQCPHVETVMKEECGGSQNECLAGQIEWIDPSCAVTEWSLWSPCSVSCGSGIKVRTRLYKVTREDQLRAGCAVQLMQKGTCSRKREGCDWGDSDDICEQEMEVGPCRGYFLRWYYESSTQTCKQFTFGGCRGNSNNFLRLEDCEKVCLKTRKDGKNDPLVISRNLLTDTSFMAALDVLAKSRKQESAEGMNEVFKEIEEQRQAVLDLENEERNLGIFFNKRGQLEAAQQKLMMMEKQVMKKKQMEMFQQKQRMMEKRVETSPYDREFSDPPALSYEYPDLATLNAPSDLHVKYADAPEYNDPPGMSMKPGFGPTLVSNTSVTSQDCELTSWSPWSSQCSTTCGRGFRHRFRQVSRPAIGAGRSCSRKLERKKRCDLPACPQPCIPQPWGSWGPCSRTCGTAGVQLRYRKGVSAVKVQYYVQGVSAVTVQYYVQGVSAVTVQYYVQGVSAVTIQCYV